MTCADSGSFLGCFQSLKRRWVSFQNVSFIEIFCFPFAPPSDCYLSEPTSPWLLPPLLSQTRLWTIPVVIKADLRPTEAPLNTVNLIGPKRASAVPDVQRALLIYHLQASCGGISLELICSCVAGVVVCSRVAVCCWNPLEMKRWGQQYDAVNWKSSS